jgi:hypothetical protein
MVKGKTGAADMSGDCEAVILFGRENAGNYEQPGRDLPARAVSMPALFMELLRSSVDRYGRPGILLGFAVLMIRSLLISRSSYDE